MIAIVLGRRGLLRLAVAAPENRDPEMLHICLHEFARLLSDIIGFATRLGGSESNPAWRFDVYRPRTNRLRPESSSSTSTTRRNAASLSLPNTLSPAQVPIASAGRPITKRPSV